METDSFNKKDHNKICKATLLNYRASLLNNEVFLFVLGS